MAVPNTRVWNMFRLLLGFAQMGGAVFSVALIILSGVTPHSLIAVVATCVLTTISVLLFGSRSGARSSGSEESARRKRVQNTNSFPFT